jgi:hypothetical protein
MLVTALASAALWGQIDSDSTIAAVDKSDNLFGNPFHFAQDLLKKHMTSSIDSAFLSAEHHKDEHKLINDNMNSTGLMRSEELSSECSQRAGLLRTAHHLTFRCDGTDSAISMIADVIHVVSSNADPVSFQAATTATSVALHLLAIDRCLDRIISAKFVRLFPKPDECLNAAA